MIKVIEVHFRPPRSESANVEMKNFGFSLGAAAALIISIVVLLAPSLASAQELASSISAAEGRAEIAKGEVDELKAALTPVSSRYVAATRRVRPANAEERNAKHQLARLESQRQIERTQVVTHIHQIEASNRESDEKHNEKVASGIGLGLAILVVGLIALSWGWFRATEAVAWLTRVILSQAAGLCIGGGLLAVIVGAVMRDAEGVVAAVGMALFALGLMLPVVFLLARHSAEIQRGRSKPILRRERFSARLTQVLAAVFGALCLVAFGSAIFAPAAHSVDVPALVRVGVDASAGARRTPAFAAAEAKALRVEHKAAPLLTSWHHAREDLRRARRALGHAESRLVAADGQAEHFSRRLVAFEAREQRDLESEERRALQEQEREERGYQKALEREEREAARGEEETEEAEACDPNYEGACLHEEIGDYDCAGGSGDGPNYVAGPIYVVGVDEFGLDSDGDGVACEDG